MKGARWVWVSLALVAVGGCGGCGSTTEPVVTAPPTPAATPTEVAVLEEAGELAGGDALVRNAYSDFFQLAVRAGEPLRIELRSDVFDPLLEATAAGVGTLANDDWEGRRDLARIDLVPPTDGELKIRVTSFAPGAMGAYRLAVLHLAASPSGLVASAPEQLPMLAPGGSLRGEVGADAALLEDGARYQSFLVDVPGRAGADLEVRPRGEARVLVVDPRGRLTEAADGRARLMESGLHRVQVVAASAAPLAFEASLRETVGAAAVPAAASMRSHHQLPAFHRATAVTVDRELDGRIDASDLALPTGERADVYAFEARAGQPLAFEMESRGLDAYLILVGPDGRVWENDDHDGTTDARIEESLPVSGTYHLVATTYRAGQEGGYALKLHSTARLTERVAARGAAPVPSDAPPAADETHGWRTFDGALAETDAAFDGGRFSDVHRFAWPAGQAVHLEARSSDFDTVLVVRSPSGQTFENDDQQPNDTNAALDLVTTEEGRYEVRVTSYRPREVGRYRLSVGTPTRPEVAEARPSATRPGRPGGAVAVDPAAGHELTGRLTDRAEHRANGAFVAYHDVRLDAGQSVRFELGSDDFDTYLLVETPSGRTLENDDVGAQNLNSAIDVPSAEAGVYRVGVTSYRPGDTGSYRVRVGLGPSVARPAAAGARDGGRVFGLFVGITDYPGGTSDLPECANDAIKLSEALRNAGLTAHDREVLLTDGRATLGNVRSALERFARELRPDDVFVFFYSGHGNRREGSRDAGELDGADETIVLFDEELVDDEMARLFDDLHAAVAILALDSCYSGGFAKDVIDAPGRMGLFSSEEDVVSMVASQFQAGGYLSHFLREGVAGGADIGPHDDVLTAGELTHYVYQQFAIHGRDIRLSSGYQHLVVDRGSIGPDRVLWGYR